MPPMRTLALTLALTAACEDAGDSNPRTDGGAAPIKDAAGASEDAGAPGVDAGPQDSTCAGPCPASAIKHVVIIVQENHTFDDHFGGYCTATPGSNPTCNVGPACCEAMPKTDPTGVAPTLLTDTEHAEWDPNHAQACELLEIDDGKMDGFATADAGAGILCGSTQNVAIADPTIIQPYWDLAATGALADRYFQPLAGQSSGNDMYLARARFVFVDNAYSPQGAIGSTCDVESTPIQYTDTTIGDLLTASSVPWAWFYEGYTNMVAAKGACPPKPADCPFPFAFYPCAMEPSDVPFEYYASMVNTSVIQDTSVLTGILAGTGGELPAVSFVKALGYHQEHPGTNITLSAGVNWATALIHAIEQSPFRDDTLVLLTYDEGGGYFDHVAPPAASPVDGQPYGMRIPLLAVGPFARSNYVSHVTMEHSSLLKFIEWNWLGQKTGQLAGRDAVVANIGSLLDPSATGVTVPEN